MLSENVLHHKSEDLAYGDKLVYLIDAMHTLSCVTCCLYSSSSSLSQSGNVYIWILWAAIWSKTCEH